MTRFPLYFFIRYDGLHVFLSINVVLVKCIVFMPSEIVLIQSTLCNANVTGLLKNPSP